MWADEHMSSHESSHEEKPVAAFARQFTQLIHGLGAIGAAKGKLEDALGTAGVGIIEVIEESAATMAKDLGAPIQRTRWIAYDVAARLDFVPRDLPLFPERPVDH